MYWAYLNGKMIVKEYNQYDRKEMDEIDELGYWRTGEFEADSEQDAFDKAFNMYDTYMNDELTDNHIDDWKDNK